MLDPGDKGFEEEDRKQRTMGEVMNYATARNSSFNYTGMHPNPWNYVEPDTDSTNCHIGTNGDNGDDGDDGASDGGGNNGNLNSELHGKLNYDTTSPWGFSSLNYGRGGYFVELPTNRSRAEEILNGLKEDRWVDQGTRAVGLTFNVYVMITLDYVMICMEYTFSLYHMVRMRSRGGC